jgi:hypothetical protein
MSDVTLIWTNAPALNNGRFKLIIPLQSAKAGITMTTNSPRFDTALSLITPNSLLIHFFSPSTESNAENSESSGYFQQKMKVIFNKFQLS